MRVLLYSSPSSLLTGYAYYAAERMAGRLVTTTLNSSLQGHINAYDLYLAEAYGSLEYVDGTLVDESGRSVEGRHTLVDSVLERTGIGGTLFVRDGNDFRRISSTIKNEDGSRAFGSMLGADSAAYQPVMSAQLYLGEAVVLGEPYLTAYDPLLDEQGRVIGIKSLAMPITEVRALVSDGLNAMVSGLLMTFLAVAVIALGSIYVLSGMILAPVPRASALLKDIAEGGGDLTQRLAIKRGDEIGDLGHWFDVFVENIQGIIRKVTGNTAQVEGQSTELAEIAERLRSGAGTTAERSASVAAASEEMSATMAVVAGATEQASNNMAAVASASDEMMSTINEIAQNASAAREITERAVGQVQSASTKVNDLGSAAREIGSFTETISLIAAQTSCCP